MIFGYLPGFITGLIICGVVSVIAATYFPSNDVTYDNKESGLQSTNVQGAIDELYGVCFPPKAGDQIIEDNGLEKDPYECRYFFTGTNPNNYVTFNGETVGWRIISVGCDGTIKIMKTANINTSNSLAWDSSKSNNWARPATLNTYLNATYYNQLNSTAQSQVVEANYNIGGVTRYGDNIQNLINEEKSSNWNGRVALPTASEYIRANSNKTQCDEWILADNYQICESTNWMHLTSNDYAWLLSPSNILSDEVFYIYADGGTMNSTDVDGVNNWNYGDARPVVTLSSDIILTGGDGSQSNPYKIE